MFPYKNLTKNTFNQNEEGYTLLELLVVLVIITLLIGIAGPQVLRQFSKAKSDTARIEVNRLLTNVEFFQVDVGRFPTEAEGLNALLAAPDGAIGWSGPYVSKSSQLVDPWDNPYEYRVITDTAGRLAAEVVSLGADGAAGGDGENRDVSSQQ
jgi:general secretion pathway protein G